MFKNINDSNPVSSYWNTSSNHIGINTGSGTELPRGHIKAAISVFSQGLAGTTE